LSQHEDSRLRFLREAQAAAKLAHPNVVTIHEVADHQGRPFFVMEHVEGQSLREFATGKDLTFEEITQLAIQLCEGIQAAHEKGIVHRDIKPGNILIDLQGRVRIVDFGLAAVRGVEHLTKTGSTLGTIGYMSPEQVNGHEVDPRSDLFSLGIVLYELVTEQNPFRRESEAATLHAIAYDQPEPPGNIRAELPARLATLITRLLEKDPSDRFQTAADVRDELVALLRAGETGADHDARKPSVAVLPFVNLSADPDQEYFCDGIAEDIISDLNHVPGLRVVARTSAFAFKGHKGDIRELGRKLGVAYLIEGSVRKAGQRVRITVQLIEVSNGYHLWSERYDRELSDIFAIQDDIARTIVDKLKLELDKLHSTRRASRDVPVEAYELYSRARYEMNHRSADSFHKALEHLQQSIHLAPEYAPARAGLADVYFLLFAYDYMTPRDAIARARTSAHRALELDDQLADAHATLGGLLTYYDWAWDDAEHAFRRALELSPGHATAHQWFGELLTYVGRQDEAEHHLETALQRDPLSVVALTMFGWHYVRRCRYQQALEYLERAEKLQIASDFTHGLTGWCHIALGNRDEGLKHLMRSREVSDDSAMSLTLWSLVHAANGDTSVARQSLDRLLARQQNEYVSQPYLAALHFILGDEDSAVACLHESIRRRDAELIFMAVMPYYSELRANPKFGQLLAILGLPVSPIPDQQ
jgi:serine/threonine-protein kinase